MSTSTPGDVVQLYVEDGVPPADVRYARAKLLTAVRYAPEPIHSMRIKLALLPDPALDRPALAQVSLDVNGRLLRARATRPTMHEAIDELSERLRDRLQRSARNWEATRGGVRPLAKQQPRAI